MSLYYLGYAGEVNPFGILAAYFAWIAYAAATNPNAYPSGSMGNF